jgi:hypothetical protein
MQLLDSKIIFYFFIFKKRTMSINGPTIPIEREVIETVQNYLINEMNIFPQTLAEYRSVINNLNSDEIREIVNSILNPSRLIGVFAVNQNLEPQSFRNWLTRGGDYPDALYKAKQFLKTGEFMKVPISINFIDNIKNIPYDIPMYVFIDGDNVQQGIIPLFNFSLAWNNSALANIFFRYDAIPPYVYVLQEIFGLNQSSLRVIPSMDNKKDAADVNLTATSTIIANNISNSTDFDRKNMTIVTNDQFAYELHLILERLLSYHFMDIDNLDFVTRFDPRNIEQDDWVSLGPVLAEALGLNYAQMNTTGYSTNWFIDFLKKYYDLPVPERYLDFVSLIRQANNRQSLLNSIGRSTQNPIDLYHQYLVLTGQRYFLPTDLQPLLGDAYIFMKDNSEFIRQGLKNLTGIRLQQFKNTEAPYQLKWLYNINTFGDALEISTILEALKITDYQRDPFGVESWVFQV